MPVSCGGQNTCPYNKTLTRIVDCNFDHVEAFSDSVRDVITRRVSNGNTAFPIFEGIKVCHHMR